MDYKTCTKCGEEFEDTVEFFSKKQSWCRGCTRKCNRELYHRIYSKDRGRHILKSVRGNAIRRKLEFNLTKEWIQERLDKGVCEVTGLCFDFGKSGLNFERRLPFTPSIDKINPKLGYTRDNCQMVVWIYNQAKGVYDKETLYTFCKAFVDKYNK